MSKVLSNYNKLVNELNEIEKKFLSSKKKINLIAVSKTFSDSHILPILKSGHKFFGENKVQEAIKKWKPLKQKYPNVELHLIGPLQSNKVNQALDIFDCIQTLDREKIVKKIKDYTLKETKLRKNYKFMIQVNIGNELKKSGIPREITESFVDWCRNDIGLNINGLMCIPPICEDPIEYFKLLSELAKKCNLQNLSMGMSSDFRQAIENGSNYIRVGSGIFGPRK